MLLFMARAAADPGVTGLFAGGLDGGQWLTMTLLSAFVIILLPRQFHVAAVENVDAREVKRAAWLFPLYLVAINIFVIPIAIAGLLLLPPGSDGDAFVLALPVSPRNVRPGWIKPSSTMMPRGGCGVLLLMPSSPQAASDVSSAAAVSANARRPTVERERTCGIIEKSFAE